MKKIRIEFMDGAEAIFENVKNIGSVSSVPKANPYAVNVKYLNENKEEIVSLIPLMQIRFIDEIIKDKNKELDTKYYLSLYISWFGSSEPIRVKLRKYETADLDKPALTDINAHFADVALLVYDAATNTILKQAPELKFVGEIITSKDDAPADWLIVKEEDLYERGI